MLSTLEINEIKNRVFDLVKFSFDGNIEVTDFDGVKVKYEDGTAVLGCITKSQLARCFFLLAMNISKGCDKIDIEQKPCFKELGVMLSMQAPLKVDFVINYMTCMAALGYTYIWLYMETTYEVKEYPFFGYMKGRYTEDDLRKIDKAGEILGIECIPCIQTFGHLSDYLRWPAAGPVKENAECLLPECEETYKFIEALIKTVSGIFKTRKVHIGFDETRGMGLGRYLINHDYPDRTALFCSHLVRVKEICFKYGLQPAMWSDMPFRLGGDGHSDEYDEKSVIPPIVSEAAAGVDMVFWDYYNSTYEPYDKCLRRHLELFPDSKITFAGGVWVLDNHIMNMPHTLNATIPAMQACIDNGIENVNATIWGNASNTNTDQSIHGLPAFSEFCYRGRDCTREDIYEVMEYLTKMSREFVEAISVFHLGYKNSLKLGSRLIWTDILYEKLRFNLDYRWAKEELSKALPVIREADVTVDPIFQEYCILLFKAAIIKCDILGGLRKAYKKGDKHFVSKVTNEYIPELMPLYEKIGDIKAHLWLRSTTPFGVEAIQIQYAGMIARLKFAKDRLSQYLKGDIDIIEELEQEILDEGYIDWLGDDNHIRI